MFLLKLPIEFLAFEAQIALLLIIHAAWTRNVNWLWAAALASVVELGIESWMFARDHATGLRDVNREVFLRYPSCEFRQVSIRDYFADSPDLFQEVLKKLPLGRQASSTLGRLHEAKVREMLGVPQVILAVPRPDSPKPTPVPTPTAFDTPDGGWIVTSDPPEEMGILTRFLMLHELGHHVDSLPTNLVRGSIFDAIKVVLALIIFAPTTWTNLLVGLALIWLLMCKILEFQIDEPANELTNEVRADGFAIDRTPNQKLRILSKLFSVSRDRARNESVISRTGFLRWQEAFGRCDDRLNDRPERDYWRLGTGDAPKFNAVAVPLLLMTFSIQNWRLVDLSVFWVKKGLILGVAFLLFHFCRGLFIRSSYARFRRAKAPFKKR